VLRHIAWILKKETTPAFKANLFQCTTFTEVRDMLNSHDPPFPFQLEEIIGEKISYPKVLMASKLNKRQEKKLRRKLRKREQKLTKYDIKEPKLFGFKDEDDMS